MALERRNPLPPGVYWQDVPREKGPLFIEWLKLNRDMVKVRKTVDDLGDAWLAAAGGKPGPVWFLFEVLPGRPVIWHGPGFPSIADKGTRTEKSDTVSRPEAEKDPLDQLSDQLPSASTIGFSMKWLIYGALAAAGYYVFKEIKEASK